MNNPIKHIFFLVLLLTCVLALDSSCSTRYQMTKEYKYVSAKKHLISLDNVWLKIFLNPQGVDAKSFKVMFVLKEVTKGKRLELSKLKINMTDAQQGDTAIFEVPVSYNKRDHGEKYDPHKKYEYPLSQAEGFELSENFTYSLDYLFTFQHAQQPVKKLQLHIQAELNDNGRIVSINKTFPFREIRYLNIAGN